MSCAISFHDIARFFPLIIVIAKEVVTEHLISSESIWLEEKQPNCPICGSMSNFVEYRGRKAARCSICHSLERHRHQWLAYISWLSKKQVDPLYVLEVGPEEWLATRFCKTSDYTSIDINPHRQPPPTTVGDICDLPYPDCSFDMVWASHVLEHVNDPSQALHEVYRVLRFKGVAFLEVPILSKLTRRYSSPDNQGHLWSPGFDWYEQYEVVGFHLEFFGWSQDLLRYSIPPCFPTPICHKPPKKAVIMKE